MKISQNTSLLKFNTFGIEVNADYFIEYESVADLQKVLELPIVKSNKLLTIGCGSNLLFLNDFKGVVLHSVCRKINLLYEGDDYVDLEIGAGVIWDDFVAYAVARNWGGLENLSHIPGEVGASAVQNIGAYGVEVQDFILAVHAVEIETGKVRAFSTSECCYAYRQSIFKDVLKGKFVITSVVFRLFKQPVFVLNYQQLEEEVLKTGEISLKHIRNTIIAIRESKLPDYKVLGNAGSFFMNPVIPKDQYHQLLSLYPQLPHYYVSENEEKIPAAWLIDQCGWKGKQIGHAAVHDKQALVIVNKGGASGAEIVHLAEQIQSSVKQKFNIVLIPEVNYIT